MEHSTVISFDFNPVLTSVIKIGYSKDEPRQKVSHRLAVPTINGKYMTAPADTTSMYDTESIYYKYKHVLKRMYNIHIY